MPPRLFETINGTDIKDAFKNGTSLKFLAQLDELGLSPSDFDKNNMIGSSVQVDDATMISLLVRDAVIPTGQFHIIFKLWGALLGARITYEIQRPNECIVRINED